MRRIDMAGRRFTQQPCSNAPTWPPYCWSTGLILTSPAEGDARLFDWRRRRTTFLLPSSCFAILPLSISAQGVTE